MEKLTVHCKIEIQGYECQATGRVSKGRLLEIQIWIPGDCVLELADLDDEDQQKVIAALKGEESKLGPKV